MKFVYTHWSEPIIWSNKIPVVVIENHYAFRSFLCDLKNGIEGQESNCILSKSNKILDCAKYAELFLDFIDFDINRKSLLTKVIANLEHTAISAENYLKTQQFLNMLEQYVEEWSFDLPFELTAKKMSITNILKSIGLEFSNDYVGACGEMEKILDYMEFVREFENDKMFVTVNMRAYFQDEELLQFLESCLSREIKLLMIESQCYSNLPCEKRLIIDEDLCEL